MLKLLFIALLCFQEREAECLEPAVFVFEDDMVLLEAKPSAAQVVKYAIATEYKSGVYNSTYNYHKIDHYLQAVERSWDVDFQRVTRGQRFTFIQSSKSLGAPNVAAVMRGGNVYISPNFNFANGPWCGVLAIHETGHVFGGTSHNRTNPNGIMGPSGGSAFLQTDYYWFRAFKFRSGLPKPHEEPAWLADWLAR
jgi:hypothetical protein